MGIYQRQGKCSSFADNLDALKQGIIAAVASIDEDMLSRVWQEIDYRMDICRVPNGSHIEHL